jgi:uncharacterized protein YecE (DUF72 family)
MYQEKFATELKIGDDVLFSGKVPQQITGTMRSKDEDGEDIVTLYTSFGIKKVHPNQVFQVKVY